MYLTFATLTSAHEKADPKQWQKAASGTLKRAQIISQDCLDRRLEEYLAN